MYPTRVSGTSHCVVLDSVGFKSFTHNKSQMSVLVPQNAMYGTNIHDAPGAMIMNDVVHAQFLSGKMGCFGGKASLGVMCLYKKHEGDGKKNKSLPGLESDLPCFSAASSSRTRNRRTAACEKT